MTKIKYDPESGAFYIRLRDGTPFEGIEIGPGAYIHVDERGTVLQLEFLSFEEFADLAASGIEIPPLIKDVEAYSQALSAQRVGPGGTPA